ncbi:hypothetical protein, partial [Synechococcus sp. MIT S9509]|uniref:hypothetical protein n=1 Tax=Synechococcus sp. MIT S9509 TaxID=1801630 RepID=UPI000AC33578
MTLLPAKTSSTTSGEGRPFPRTQSLAQSLAQSSNSVIQQFSKQQTRRFLKHDPLAVSTVKRLVDYCLPERSAPINISIATDDWWLPRELRNLHCDSVPGGDPRSLVASKLFELDCAGGGDRLQKVGVAWNCRHRIYGWDVDNEWLADHDGRGCNHPDNDGGNFVQRARELVEELTGGELIITFNPVSGGLWLLGVAPEGVDAELLAQDLLRKLREEGFHIGKGRLELPLNNARLPLAGYVLEGHESRPWIEQVGELVAWMDEQVDTVELKRPLRTTSKQLELLPRLDAGERADHKGVTFQNLRWRREAGSNGFLCTCAIRMARAGHGIESAPLMVSMVEAHHDWQRCASSNSKAVLWKWCHRWMAWAERNIQGVARTPAGPSNQQKHQSWNDRVITGVAAAVKAGKRRITAVIDHLKHHQQMSKRLLWERAELIQQGIDQELEKAADDCSEQACLPVTPTQLIPMGVKGSGAAQEVGCSGSESFDLAVSVSPARFAESGMVGVPLETEKTASENGFSSSISSNFSRLRDLCAGLLKQKRPDSTPNDRGEAGKAGYVGSRPGSEPPGCDLVARRAHNPKVESSNPTLSVRRAHSCSNEAALTSSDLDPGAHHQLRSPSDIGAVCDGQAPVGSALLWGSRGHDHAGIGSARALGALGRR